ncbi:hypothetical protein BDV12DRAFT_189825 [Aspergillus spectabilis]
MSNPLPSATPRSSGLTVPATQNTAPVIKYRCLFTHDMRRKAKRWQDGFLRYHTFNKRVMVYDNTGYFIGDLHWRAPEGIQDGDELELDKGVLIQVCEPLEQTETDISSLYKNKSQTSPSRTEAPPSSVRSTAPRAHLSQTSRSLKDLLGINKSPTPQLLSPYEQRQRQRQTSTHQLHERPAKRQRTTSPEPRQQDVVDLSDSPPRAQQAPRTELRSKPPIPKLDRNAAVPKSRLPPDFSKTAPKQPNVPPTPPSAQPASHNQRASSGTEPSNTLRLPSDKPRRKLMYQESTRASKISQPRTQPSRTHSQCQPPTKHNSASSPVIVLDDDEPPAQPQPKITPPARTAVESRSLQFKTNSSSEVAKANQNSEPFITNPSERGQPPHKSTTSINPSLPPVLAYSRPTGQPTTKPPENTAKVRLTGLRKSLSDPTTITSLHSRPISAPSPLNPITGGHDEQGPWTSEALDLFDFWPPGRPKPI